MDGMGEMGWDRMDAMGVMDGVDGMASDGLWWKGLFGQRWDGDGVVGAGGLEGKWVGWDGWDGWDGCCR